MTNKRLVTWSCPNCDNYHKWTWDKWDIYDGKIGMTCDKCGKTTQMEMIQDPANGNGHAVLHMEQKDKEPEITLKLSLEELKLIDKYVELNDETSEIFDKIKDAYPKSKTLTDIVTRWWCDVFTTKNFDWGMETSVEDLVDRIELFLLKHQSEECVKQIRGKMR